MIATPTEKNIRTPWPRAARRHGVIVSYDLNHRPSLWQAIGGRQRAREVNRRLVRLVDVLIGNEEDFTASLGCDLPSTGADFLDLDTTQFRAMLAEVVREFDAIQVVATTMRGVRTATRNDWGAIAWSASTGFVEATHRPDLEILDRVGGGDSFVAGLA